MKKYVPPFVITNQILTYVSSIMEKLGNIASFNNLNKLPTLRRENRIKSIQSSCSIEANSLSLDQVTDAINGHKVIGPVKDVLEIQNAINAYDVAFKMNPFSTKDLKSIHSLMTAGLVTTPGRYRTSGEGVMDSSGKVIFIAPPAKMVAGLMTDLFSWIKDNFSIINPLVLSSVFHYEFVFIHPFSDGNGRMARLWQNLILAKWKPIFEYIPIESLIKNYQNDYYKAIALSNKKGDSTIFITFMLKMIDLSISQLIKDASLKINNESIYVKKLVHLLKKNRWYSSREMQNLLGLSDIMNFRKKYLLPAISAGLLIQEFPDKPTSKNQRYKLN